MKSKLRYAFVILALVAGGHQAGAEQSTAFTYQGQLSDGGINANGVYTLIFALYDQASGGNEINNTFITTTQTLANGLFTVNLDFGPGAFDGNARWLDITVTNGGDTQTLSPRPLDATEVSVETASGKQFIEHGHFRLWGPKSARKNWQS